jgi:hypothetical protein
MSLSPTKRRAEQFADLLERGAQTDDPTYAPLVDLGAALRFAAETDGPAPEFRTALRQRLVAVATVQGVGESRSTTERVRESAGAWRFQRRIAVLAGGAAAVTAVAGVGIGASRSLPGDAFYGLKRTSESVQLDLARGDEAKGKKHLEFARTRLSEVRALVARGEALPALVPGQPGAAGLPDTSDSLIASTLRQMDDETRAGAQDLFLAYQHSGSTEPLVALHEFTRAQYAELHALLPALGAHVASPARQSLALLKVVATETVRLVPQRTAGSHRSGRPAPTSHPSKTARPTHHGGTAHPTPTATSTPSSSGGGSAPGSKQQPADVPTIPPLPTGPLPTDLPSTLPPLPNGGSILPIG